MFTPFITELDSSKIEPAGLPLVVTVYNPVRVESLGPDQAADFGRSLERLLGEVRNMVYDDVFSDEDASVVEHVLGSLERELFHSPVEPDGTVLAAYSASLLRRIGPYLPEDVSNDNDPEPGWDAAAVHQMFDEASRLGEGTSDSDGEHAANVVEAMACMSPLVWWGSRERCLVWLTRVVRVERGHYRAVW